MSDVLKEWLVHQLGLEVGSLRPDNVCRMFRNGFLIGKILASYDVVSARELSLLVDGHDDGTKKSNFRHLGAWLDAIGVPLDGETTGGIASGHGPAVYAFLYTLCFALENPNRLNLTGHVRRVCASFGSFDFLGVSGARPHHRAVVPVPPPSSRGPRQPYARNYALESGQTRRDNLAALLGEIDEFGRGLPETMRAWSTRGDQSCTRFVSDIKFRAQHSKLYGSWRTKTANAYAQSTADANSRRNREALRHKSVPDKLIYVSNYERSVLEKINSARFVIEKRNAISVENELKFTSGECNTAERDSDTTAMATIADGELPTILNEFIERNTRQANVENAEIIKTVVRDLVDLGIKVGRRNKQYGGTVIGKYVWDNWVEMFLGGRPLLNGLDDNLGLLLDPRFVDDNRPRSDEELKTQAMLNRIDVEQYLRGTGSWSKRALDLNSNHDPFCGSRRLGFYVHDVLTSLYALPNSLVDIDGTAVRSCSVRGVLRCDIDGPSTDRLCTALVDRGMLPVSLYAALRYCLSAYCREADGAELLRTLENRNSNEYSENSEEKTLALNRVNIILTNSDCNSMKQTQTPDTIDTRYDFERVACGKDAFVNIYNGKPIPKYCLIDCVLAYIKANVMSQGFVLIGFPQEELMMLEERLANKHYPPYGSYDYMKNKILSIMVPHRGPELGDEGKYKTSFTSYIFVFSGELLINEKWEDLYKYYTTHNVLTLLTTSERTLDLNSRKIELFCDVLAGKLVNWTEESDWVKCIHDTQTIENESLKEDLTRPKIIRRHGKSEIDLIDQFTTIGPKTFSNSIVSSIQDMPNQLSQIESIMFNVQLGGNIGVAFGNFWKALENEFIGKMEKCLFHRRILLCEQEPYVFSVSKYLNEILRKRDMTKIELVKRLQTDLYNIPNNVLAISDIIRQSLLAVSDVKASLTQLTYRKIDKCRHCIINDNTENWLEKQCNSMMSVYKWILQIEVDRTVNILRFINSYMSKLYNQEIPISIIPKQIEVMLNKNIGSKMSVNQNTNKNTEYVKKFSGAVKLFADKIKAIFTTTSQWLDDTKKINSNKSLENFNPIYLKIWECLVIKENWRSTYQLKLISARFQMDIKEMENVFLQYISNINQRIDERLHDELVGIERVCNLFETAISEGKVVRHEIIPVDDHFYLNPANIIYPSHRPPEPFPLLEPDGDLYVTTTAGLEIITNQLRAICPDKRVSLIYFSDWLTDYVKYLPRADSFNTTALVLRTMFGYDVNYVDWTDFVMHCMELSYPGIDDLLELKNQYADREKNREKITGRIHVEGTVDRCAFDSVLLWYQKTLPSSPSDCLRDLKIKDLLFTLFSLDGGEFDYITMLLALCKDDSPTTGLIKAVSLLTGRNILRDQRPDSNSEYSGGEENCLQFLPMETVYNALIVCLKNYMAPDKSDIEELVSSLLNVYKTDDIIDGRQNTDSVLELFNSDGMKSLSETGHRFNSRSLSTILKSIR